MPFEKPTAVEIDRKLRDDFRRRLRDFGVSAEATDPVLAVLFRTLGGQLEDLYSASDRIRLALLDELVSGLGIEARRARAAQTVVRLLTSGNPQLVEAGAELIGETDSGDRLTFTTDVTVNVSAARIALAATYQNGEFRLLPGFEMPDEMQAARPSLEPVRANLGSHPAVYLAIENLPEDHLGRHGFFIELGPDAAAVGRALQTEPWCLASHEGDLGAKGILRPRRTNAGVRHLEWLVPERVKEPEESAESDVEVADLPDGFYAGRVFVFPNVPAGRRFLRGVPKAMETIMQRIFGPATERIVSVERAWLRISLPRDVPELHNAITNISLHAVTASNAECFNETIIYAQHGTSIPVSREGGTSKYLVAPLSIFGESGGAYLPPFEPSADLDVGRYSIHNGRVHLYPAKRTGVVEDGYANLRLWLTGGTIGNRVGPGQIQSFLKKGQSQGLRIINPTSAAGGTDGEDFEQGRRRFAAALLSRDRIVTRADLDATVRAFDRRISGVSLALGVDRTDHGLQRVQKVRCQVDREEFVDPDQEIPILTEELREHLEKRFLYDVAVSLRVEAQ
jgi:hypothetical protein